MLQRWRVLIVLFALLFVLLSANDTLRGFNDEVSTSNVNKIVGGVPVPLGRFPWMTSLWYSTNLTFPKCGGALISSNIILSSGHCSGAIKVKVGCLLVTDACETFTILNEVVHPSYGGTLVPNNDFMLLRLNGNSVKSPIAYVADASLATAFISGYHFTVMGWGTTSSGGPQSAALLQAGVQAVINSECETKYEATGNFNLIKPEMLCAAASGKDSCQGDSGGPLIVRCDATNQDILAGIVSWGFGCADPNFPGVYARVSSGRPFINAQLSAWGRSLASVPPLSNFCPIVLPPAFFPVVSPVLPPVVIQPIVFPVVAPSPTPRPTLLTIPPVLFPFGPTLPPFPITLGNKNDGDK